MTPPPGKRHEGQRDYPDNLYSQARSSGLYFRYRRPDLPKGHPDQYVTLGYVSKEEAFAAAKQANQAFSKGRNLLAKMQGRSGITLDQYIDIFIDTHLKERRISGEPLSEHTITAYLLTYRKMKRDPGLRAIYLRSDATQMEMVRDQSELARYLSGCSTSEVFNKHRTRLMDLYKHAVSDGLIPDNIPARILPKPKGKKVRQRLSQPTGPGQAGKAAALSIEAYNAIFAKAEIHIQIAMELALNVMQRRMELHAWRYDWSHEDSDGRHVYIAISKTRKHGAASFIRVPEFLPMAHSAFGCKTLGDLIKLSRKSDTLAAQHVVHHRPSKVKKSGEKEHPFQLSRRQIGDGFTAARDAAGIYDHLAQGQRPTLHELIATGEYLREQMGWTTEVIAQYRGHNKITTTQTYLEGHEYKTVVVPIGTRRE
jgi:hypothetical protein